MHVYSNKHRGVYYKPGTFATGGGGGGIFSVSFAIEKAMFSTVNDKINNKFKSHCNLSVLCTDFKKQKSFAK